MKKNLSKTVLLVLIVAVFFIGGAVLFKGGGNVEEFPKAEEAIQSYVKTNYGSRLSVGEVEYSSKAMAYIAEVTEKDDPRNRALIEWSGEGNILDGYADAVKLHIGEGVQEKLYQLVEQSMGMPKEALQLSVDAQVPKNQYTMADEYDGSYPLRGSISFTEQFETKEAFAKAAWTVLQAVQQSGFSFQTLELYAYMPDGDHCFVTQIEQPIKSEQEFLNATKEEYRGK